MIMDIENMKVTRDTIEELTGEEAILRQLDNKYVIEHGVFKALYEVEDGEIIYVGCQLNNEVGYTWVNKEVKDRYTLQFVLDSLWNICKDGFVILD